MKKNFVVLVDMDEVLVDFVGGALRVHGKTREELEAKWEPGYWHIAPPLGLSTDEFWEPIHAAGKEFWLSLEPLPWFDAMLNLVDDYDWHVVTAPSRCSTSYDGKVCWLKKKLGQNFDRFVITPHKYLLSAHRRILIDDRADNCTEFIKNGGSAVLFPSRGNYLYTAADRPVESVRAHLTELIRDIERFENRCT